MRILIISNIFPPGFIGGYELAAEEVARYISQAGHEVTILTSDYFYGDLHLPLQCDRSLQCVGIDHARPRSSDAYIKINVINYRNIRILSRAIENFKPDVIICFNLAGLGPVGIVKFLEDARLPTLFYFMDTPFAGIDRNGHTWELIERVFGRPQLNLKSSAIFMSELVKEEIEIFFDCSSCSKIIPGWVDTGLIQEIKTFGNPVPFVFCSRVTVHKGIDLVVDAVRIGREQGMDLHVDVYGAGDISLLGQKCRMAGVDDLISYKGSLKKSEVVTTLAQYRGLLFPTAVREPFGFIVAESALGGCVPIMTSGIGASDWFVSDEDCFKVPRRSEALLSAMLKIKAMSDDELRAMAMKAQSAALKYLSSSYWLNTVLAKVLTMSTTESDIFDPRLKTAYLYLADLCEA